MTLKINSPWTAKDWKIFGNGNQFKMDVYAAHPEIKKGPVPHSLYDWREGPAQTEFEVKTWDSKIVRVRFERPLMGFGGNCRWRVSVIG